MSPLRQHGGAIEYRAIEVHRAYASCIADVLQRVRVQHDERRALPDSNRTDVRKTHQLGGSRCRRDDGVHRAETELHPTSELDVFAGWAVGAAWAMALWLVSYAVSRRQRAADAPLQDEAAT